MLAYPLSRSISSALPGAMWPPLSFCISALLIHLCTIVNYALGVQYCKDSSDCIMLIGYTCQNKQCVCEPSVDTGLFPCVQVRNYGEKCRSDQDCFPGDVNLVCLRTTESRTCRCRRGLVWDIVSKRCYLIEDQNTFISSKFDADVITDIIVPAVIIMTLGATAWLCFQFFCNCGKKWRRRRRRGGNTGRNVEEAELPAHPQPTAWVASYRVYSPMGGLEGHRGAPFPPCLLLPVGPPTYEESLKHKVILSSYPTAVSQL